MTSVVFRGLGLFAVLLLVGAIQSGCNKVPVKAIKGEYTVQNEIRDTRPDIPKIDILFVIDNSHSMCEEQINIGKNFDKFIKDFKDTIKADFRIGVVTTDASDPNKGGKFREELGSFTSCPVDVDTSACKNFKLAGGIITSTDKTLNLEQAFSCISTVGTVQGGLAQIEQGLKAARYALDKKGPLPTQAQNFLRDDAFLAIIIVSDEDDCSWKDGVEWTNENFSRCALMPEKLVPVGDYVNFFKRLKPSDPGKVVVAVISGDAVVPGHEASEPGFNVLPQVISQREDFLTDKAAGGQNVFICESSNGRADYGRRYRELVDKFGSNGVFANICQDDFGPALALISKRIIDNIYSSCLSRPIATGNLSQVGQTCQTAANCINGRCINGTCTALGDIGEVCSAGTDCYSGQCTGGRCACSSGNCPNAYTPFKVFLTVEKTLSNGQKITLGANDYEIQEQVKCVSEDNPRGLAVIPDSVPEAGAIFRVAYEARVLTDTN